MKKVIFLSLALFSVTFAVAQEKAKSGWSFLPMPDFSYNSDLGMSLGAWGDIFYYGTPENTVYPNYIHHAGFTGAYATKGSWYLHAFYESEHLIPGIGLKLSATYRDVSTNNFYGYNGIAAPYDQARDMNAETREAYYTNDRRFFRAAALAQGKISGRLSWMGGAVFRRVHIKDYSLKNYDSGNSLYLDYIDNNLIRADEAGGGTSLDLKAGLNYDSRNYPLSPSSGIYSDLYLISNFDLGGKGYNYGQIVADFRQYLTLLPERIVFAYHLALQHQLWGSIPFYNINELATPEYRYEEFSGLGSRYSIRGYRYNRISAAGYAWGNFELRCTPFIFDLWNQHIELLAIPFVDLGAITRTYRLEEQKLLGDKFYQDIKLPVMASGGIGFKFQMNHNFIIAVDFAKAFNPQLSDFMIGMASSYIF